VCGPSLYKHLPDKAALEAEIISDGFAEAAAALEAAVDGAGEPLTAFVDAYRAFAVAHPPVYRLMTERPLPRERLPPGLETRTLVADGCSSATRSDRAGSRSWVTMGCDSSCSAGRRRPRSGGGGRDGTPSPGT